jgi:hypothetical protein
VTVIFKAVAGAKRWQPLARPRGAEGAASVEDNYTVILGSHRNSRLKFEKNGEEMELVGSCRAAGGGLRDSAFARDKGDQAVADGSRAQRLLLAVRRRGGATSVHHAHAARPRASPPRAAIQSH